MKTMVNRINKLEDASNISKKMVVLFCKEERKESRADHFQTYDERKLLVQHYREQRGEEDVDAFREEDRLRSVRLCEEAVEEYKNNNRTFPGQCIMAMTHLDAACL